MALMSIRDVTLSWGGPPLLENVTFHIEQGERIALVGRNGSGKSTLMKLLAGDHTPDGGEIALQQGRRISRLPQEVPHHIEGEVFDVVASGVQELGSLLAEYHHLSHDLAESDGARTETVLGRLEQVQHQLEAAGGWHLHQRVETVVSRLRLPDGDRFETLSGGLKRRVLLARALVSEPDVLLLDEPTNHLDIEAIEWLEDLLLNLPSALVFVTHDRAFLKKIANRILEVDRGRLSDWPGDYNRYLQRKEEQLKVEAEHWERFNKKLAQEEAWIRQGIKARRTRNEGRVRALEKLRSEAKARRHVQGRAQARLDEAEASGKRVIELKNVSFAYPADEEAQTPASPPIVRDLSTIICRGDKVGILGPNGSGKTTLLKLLLGDLKADAGKVKHGTRLEIAYFDQHREQLDENASVADNVAEGADKITVNGKTRHVIGYLESFLFPPAQTRSPVKSLSGGERNRLLLARLFTRPFNVLVMDEPTNDLDVETLELLEARLVEFGGTLLLVSHDRDFLDNVVTSSLVMEGGGKVGEYAGGYSDWLVQRPQIDTSPKKAKKSESEKSRRSDSKAKDPSAGGKRKLTYKEKRDLEELPGRIESLEQEQGELQAKLADPELYKRGDSDEIQSAKTRLEEVESELETAYDRWAELEEIEN